MFFFSNFADDTRNCRRSWSLGKNLWSINIDDVTLLLCIIKPCPLTDLITMHLDILSKWFFFFFACLIFLLTGSSKFYPPPLFFWLVVRGYFMFVATQWLKQNCYPFPGARLGIILCITLNKNFLFCAYLMFKVKSLWFSSVAQYEKDPH